MHEEKKKGGEKKGRTEKKGGEKRRRKKRCFTGNRTKGIISKTFRVLQLGSCVVNVNET